MDFGFYIKKLVSGFSMPLTFVISLLLLGTLFLWLNKRQKMGRWLVTFGVLCLYLISFSPFSNMLLEPIEKSYPYFQSFDKNIDYVVVLGHRSKPDPKLPLSSQLSYVSINRLVEGLRIYRQYPNAKLIFSGANTLENGSHPERVKQMAIALGVPKNDIIVVDKAKDTHDEAMAIRLIVRAKKFALVSSASHMQRAMALFKGQGLNPIAAPTYFRVKENKTLGLFSFFPSPFAIEKSQFAIHEYLGILWSKLRGQQ